MTTTFLVSIEFVRLRNLISVSKPGSAINYYGAQSDEQPVDSRGFWSVLRGLTFVLQACPDIGTAARMQPKTTAHKRSDPAVGLRRSLNNGTERPTISRNARA